MYVLLYLETMFNFIIMLIRSGSGFLIRNHSSSPQNRIYYLSKKSFDLQAACFFLDLIVNKPSLLKSHSNKSYLYHQKVIDTFWPSQWAALDGFVFNWEDIKPSRAPDKEARPNPFMLAWVTNVLTGPDLYSVDSIKHTVLLKILSLLSVLFY